MKPNARINPVLLAGFAALLGACQFSSVPALAPTQLEQNPPSLSQVESPLLTVVESLDSVSAYHVTLHQEVRHTQPDGSTFPEIAEYNYFWTHNEGQYGYNSHGITTMIDPQSGVPLAMDESYMIDGLAFMYCATCPGTAEQAGWSVSQRSEGNIPGSPLDMDSVERKTGIPIAALVAQSVVIGDERISGISATHYRLTDSQALSEAIRMLMGGATNTSVEVAMAQMDTWLTVGDHQPIQYTFQAEGRTESIAGSQVLQPFTIQNQYSVTEINSNRPITVSTEILTAVAPQLKTLEIK